MDPTRLYDYLSLTRAKVFEWIRPLSSEQYAREFPFGYKSLKATLPHMLNAEWVYARRFSGQPVPKPIPKSAFPVHPDEHPEFAAMEAAWHEQEKVTRAAMAMVPEWGVVRQYVVDWDGVDMQVTATSGDIFSQLVIHEAHHRAQVMAMLRQMGVAAEDLDYSFWMYKRVRV